VRKRAVISLLFTNGKSLKGDFLRIAYRSPGDVPKSVFPSVMFAVSKKTLPSAVRRNRAKRMMREAYRLEKPFIAQRMRETSLSALPGPVDMVLLYTRKGGAIPTLDDFRREFRTLVSQIRFS
jgi:ribonuclease P protein component